MEEEKNKTLEEGLNSRRQVFDNIIKELNQKMSSIDGLSEVINKVYSFRQDLIEYYYTLLNLLLSLQRKYNKKSSDLYYNFKVNGNNGYRYSSDSAINNAINAKLIEDKEKIDLLSVQTKYIEGTLKTLDNLIFSIGTKLKIFEYQHQFDK